MSKNYVPVAERCKWAEGLHGSGINFFCTCPRRTNTACVGFDDCKDFEKRGKRGKEDLSQKHFNSLKNLKEILKQNATRWMIIKDAEEWFEGFEKKHREFVNGKIYDWLEANVPGWAAKGCCYMDLLVLFIEKEILGEKREI